MKRRIILALALAIMMTGMSAFAMPIMISNGTLTTTATSAADGSEYALDTREFQLLGSRLTLLITISRLLTAFSVEELKRQVEHLWEK